MTKFISFLAPLIRKFIRYRQASDHWNDASYEVNLKLFDRHCHKCDSSPDAELIQEMSDSWCRQRENEENNSCRSRIYVVVSFIKFLHGRGLTNVTPPILPRREKRTYIPHSFTKEELVAFFQECDRISARKNNHQDACRKLTVPVFFRLLYSSGIRTNEARLLKREDIDLFQGVINIRYSKGHNQHYIVLHDTILPLIKKYDEAISLLVPDRVWFFPSRDGSYYKKGWVIKTFNQIWRKTNTSHAVSYEFRHNYAVENINKWISEGFDFDDKLLYLSKSMGHTTIESTKYYYSIVPGLSDILEDQTEEGFDWIIPEVCDDEEE